MKATNKPQPDYLAYLLRLWRVSSDEEPVWRATLESPRTHEQVGFDSLDALFQFLRRQTGGSIDDMADDHRL